VVFIAVSVVPDDPPLSPPPELFELPVQPASTSGTDAAVAPRNARRPYRCRAEPRAEVSLASVWLSSTSAQNDHHLINILEKNNYLGWFSRISSVLISKTSRLSISNRKR